MTIAAPVRESDHPYLSGNYAPVSEEISAVDLDVSGSIPDYLDGRYLRIGPNPMGDPDPARYHWFLGAGMAHGLRLRDGKAHWYRNRWVRSADVSRKLGEPWPGGPTYGGFDFASNTNIIGHAGKTFAIAESRRAALRADRRTRHRWRRQISAARCSAATPLIRSATRSR